MKDQSEVAKALISGKEEYAFKLLKEAYKLSGEEVTRQFIRRRIRERKKKLGL